MLCDQFYVVFVIGDEIKDLCKTSEPKYFFLKSHILQISDIYLSSRTPVKLPCMRNYPENSTDFHKQCI